jgi:hypothetical protein
LTPVQINQIAFAVREGIAKKEDAKRLMAHFCELVERREPFPARLLEHFREAFNVYLNGTKRLEAALGVVRKKGRPPGDEIKRAEMAAEVLRERLAGKTHERALIHMVEEFGWNETVVSEAWRDYRMSALDLVIIERASAKREPKFTYKERQRFREIFRNMPPIDDCGKIVD